MIWDLLFYFHGIFTKNWRSTLDGLFACGDSLPHFLSFFSFAPAHPWQGRQQMHWNELSINFSDVLDLDPASLFIPGIPCSPSEIWLRRFYIISTKGYYTHTPCWHLKGGKSKKKDGKYFGFKMGNLGIDFLLHIDFLGTLQSRLFFFFFFFWQDFLFRSRLMIPFAGNNRLPSQSTKAEGRGWASRPTGYYYLVGPKCCCPCFFFLFILHCTMNLGGGKRKEKSLWAVLGQFYMV